MLVGQVTFGCLNEQVTHGKKVPSLQKNSIDAYHGFFTCFRVDHKHEQRQILWDEGKASSVFYSYNSFISKCFQRCALCVWCVTKVDNSYSV